MWGGDSPRLVQAETKAQPKQLKTIRSSIQREMTDTVKVTKQRHSVMQKQLLETAPKEAQKQLLLQQRREFEAEMVKTSTEFERKVSMSILPCRDAHRRFAPPRYALLLWRESSRGCGCTSRVCAVCVRDGRVRLGAHGRWRCVRALGR
jgi:hypothetical protein